MFLALGSPPVNTAQPTRIPAQESRGALHHGASRYVSLPGVPAARIGVYTPREPRRRLQPIPSGPTYADFFLEDTARHATA